MSIGNDKQSQYSAVIVDCSDKTESVDAVLEALIKECPEALIVGIELLTSLYKGNRSRFAQFFCKPILPSLVLRDILKHIENGALTTEARVASSLNVLVVDDVETNLIVARLALQQLGHACSCVGSGERRYSAG